MAKFSATQLDIFFAVVLFLAGLGYAVSGFPASIAVACFIWGTAWLFFTHLFFIYDGTASCPLDVKIVLWCAVTFWIIMTLWTPVRVQYAKEHAPPLVAPPVSAPASMPSPTPALKPPRSYVVFEGYPIFPPYKDQQGQLLPDLNLKVGNPLVFNFGYTQAGPNPVEMRELFYALYLEPDFQPPTHKQVAAAFKKLIRTIRSKMKGRRDSVTLAQGQHPFNSAATDDDAGRPRIITQAGLDALHAGTQVVFVVAQITYEDNKKVHHARMCSFLQPPAYFPGIWQTCQNEFSHSD